MAGLYLENTRADHRVGEYETSGRYSIETACCMFEAID
jgi:hypothetical protein